jgi:hypothetical protein
VGPNERITPFLPFLTIDMDCGLALMNLLNLLPVMIAVFLMLLTKLQFSWSIIGDASVLKVVIEAARQAVQNCQISPIDSQS